MIPPFLICNAQQELLAYELSLACESLKAYENFLRFFKKVLKNLSNKIFFVEDHENHLSEKLNQRCFTRISSVNSNKN